MEKIYVEFTFLLASGKTRVVTVKDIKSDVTSSELLALANKFIDKNSQHQGSLFTSLEKCEKFTLETEVIS